MRITDFMASYLEIPFAEPGMRSSAYGVKKSWGFTLVKIFTDDGIVGVGGQNSAIAGGRYFSKILNESMKPILLDNIVDPHNVELFAAYLRALSPSSNLCPRPSSVEMALWDIIGKSEKKPVYKILGARQEKIKTYINSTTKFPRWESDDIANFAVKCLEKGYRGIKTNIYDSIKVHKDIESVKAIRAAVGDEMEIMVDAQASLSPWSSRQFSYSTALKIAREFEKFDCLWLEDVLPYYPKQIVNHEHCRRLAAEVDILIASGGQLFGAYTFETLMRQNVLDVVQPDIMHVGGIGELVKVGNLAEMYNKMCCPHTGYVPGLVTAATLQASGGTKASYVETLLEPYAALEIRDSILTEPIEIEKDGYIRIPQKPGLGIELNDQNVEKFTVK